MFAVILLQAASAGVQLLLKVADSGEDRHASPRLVCVLPFPPAVMLLFACCERDMLIACYYLAVTCSLHDKENDKCSIMQACRQVADGQAASGLGRCTDNRPTDRQAEDLTGNLVQDLQQASSSENFSASCG